MRGRALILVENLSVPFDRRVWQECLALVGAGYEVAVISPTGAVRDSERFERLNGVDIYRYPLRTGSTRMASYVFEYATALLQTHRLIRRLTRQRPFDVVQACNPPDILFLAAIHLKPRGTRFIFDQHDLVPELYLSRFGRGKDLGYRLTTWAEKFAFVMADVVISTNESYRRAALQRGGLRPADVVIVRSAPDLSRFRQVAPVPELRHAKDHLIAYLGVMGPQDGVDHALRALAALAERRDDWHAIFIGSGDVAEDMHALARKLGLGGRVEFTGRIPDEDVLRVLSTCDVCLAPDPLNPLNDVSTMNKILEYMAMSKPIVSYDLAEARVSAGDAALYAKPNSEVDFANCIDKLLSDPELRASMGSAGRRRLEQKLSWRHSERKLLRAYERALTKPGGRWR